MALSEYNSHPAMGAGAPGNLHKSEGRAKPTYGRYTCLSEIKHPAKHYHMLGEYLGSTGLRYLHAQFLISEIIC